MREGDTVARLGGDEFTLLLPGHAARAEDAAKVAEKILEDAAHPFRLEGRELFVTASIGISLYPDDGADAETLVKNADTAMYRAKEQGRDNYQLYTPAMNETRGGAPGAWRAACASALAQRRAGPALPAAGGPRPRGRVHGVEALLRWQHPERGLRRARPSSSRLAEMTGLIVPMGPWVLRTACAQARAWQAPGHPELRVAVNLSARQFQQPDLVRHGASAPWTRPACRRAAWSSRSPRPTPCRTRRPPS